TIPMEAVSPVSRAYSSASQKYSSVALAPSSVFSVATAGKLGSGTFWAGPSADAGMYSVGSTSDASVVSSSSTSSSLVHPARHTVMDSAARQANIRAEAGCFDKDIKALSMSEDLELSKQNSLSEQCNPYLTCRLGKSSTMSRDPCSYPHRRR